MIEFSTFYPLFAQQQSYGVIDRGSNPSFVTPAIVATVILLLLLLIGVAVLLISLRHARRSRELLHTERLKAIEAGLTWQDADAESSEKKFMHNAFWISFWIIAFGCGSPFTAAARVMGETSFENTTVVIAVWFFAALASIGSVAGATVLMIKSRGKRS